MHYAQIQREHKSVQLKTKSSKWESVKSSLLRPQSVSVASTDASAGKDSTKRTVSEEYNLALFLGVSTKKDKGKNKHDKDNGSPAPQAIRRNSSLLTPHNRPSFFGGEEAMMEAMRTRSPPNSPPGSPIGRKGSFDGLGSEAELSRFQVDEKHVIREGSCKKSDPYGKNWKKRWFILTANEMVYQKTRSSTSAAGSIPITMDTEVMLVTPKEVAFKCPTPFLIQIETESRIYNICAESQMNAVDWYNSILFARSVHTDIKIAESERIASAQSQSLTSKVEVISNDDGPRRPSILKKRRFSSDEIEISSIANDDVIASPLNATAPLESMGGSASPMDTSKVSATMRKSSLGELGTINIDAMDTRDVIKQATVEKPIISIPIFLQNVGVKYLLIDGTDNVKGEVRNFVLKHSMNENVIPSILDLVAAQRSYMELQIKSAVDVALSSDPSKKSPASDKGVEKPKEDITAMGEGLVEIQTENTKLKQTVSMLKSKSLETIQNFKEKILILEDESRQKSEAINSYKMMFESLQADIKRREEAASSAVEFWKAKNTKVDPYLPKESDSSVPLTPTGAHSVTLKGGDEEGGKESNSSTASSNDQQDRVSQLQLQLAKMTIENAQLKMAASHAIILATKLSTHIITKGPQEQVEV